MNRSRHLFLTAVLALPAFLSIAKFGAADEPAEVSELPPAVPGLDVPGLELAGVPDKVVQLMQDRDYAQAIEAIDEASQAEGGPRDYLGYLKGRALHLSGKYDEAVAAFELVELQFAQSPWARRARFGRAVSLARKGEFVTAESIYREEALRLLSLDRKQEIADIYLEFADAYFKPADENQPPDYAKALEFYTKALEVGPQPDKRAEVELLVARCHQALGNLQEAANRYRQFSQERPDHALALEARYRLGESQLGLGQPEEARRTWQDLVAAHPDDESQRIAEAMFNLSQTYGLPAPHTDDDLNLGVAALEAFLKRFPAHKLASQAHLRIAVSYLHRGRHEDVVKTLQRFLSDERYAATDEAPQARQLLGRAYQLQKKFTEALETWHEYLARHPAHQAWSEVQRQIIDTEFLLGYEARQADQYDAARKLWGEFLVKHPLDARNPRILYEFGHMELLQDQWEEAIAEWRRLVSKYPETNESSLAQLMIAVTLEEKLGKFDEALKEYRKLTWGSQASQAQLRVARLTAKDLAIATVRVFRTNETPKIKLTTRNIDKLSVRAYAVDLETYFRKMHLASGVEGLDIGLIDPDRTFEFAVPGYTEYQQLENEIEIPLPAREPGAPPAGVMAVTVSSRSLEATTLVVQSDLDVIIKSSRDELFVFAQNMRSGQPWPGVRLLISNGQQVFAEAQTGDDGVLQQTFEELKSAGDVRVFAVAEGSVASNVVNLEGVGVAQGLTDRGYIYTDRPAYRAGQLVHVRGIIRAAADDLFRVEPGKKYHLEVFDPRNRLLRQDEVALGEFGSFHANFVLPAASSTGQYRVQVRDDENHSYQGEFIVHEYQLEPVRLAVDTERRVFYRGEEIEGTISARFYYGAPLAGREIRYQLAGGRIYTDKTDERGEVRFKLATREFRESQVLPLAVTLAERNLQATVNFYLATQGFSIAVSTARPVYIAGETFEATVATTDAEGKPSGQNLVLRVLERTAVEGKVGEREVESHEVVTDEKEGRARVTLRLETGAEYVLRVEGTDRFQNPVTAARAIQVSDERDAVRLRILADRHTFKVGDVARVQLHWREAPALALVTFQGARILDYKLVELREGANELEIPLTARLSPNFELAVAVMTDAHPPKEPEQAARFTRFHTASSPFTVERDLQVKLTPKRKGEAQGPVRPGEEIEVEIVTSDPQGQPVAAELSLALVERSLWEMFGAGEEPIADFFRGTTREPAVRTTSSVTFAYRPSTKPINPQLLAEQDRLEIAAEEAERLAAAGGVPAGGAAAASDFESLIDLIQSTIEPESWPMEVPEFEGNLSMAISQTQEVHEDFDGDNGFMQQLDEESAAEFEENLSLIIDQSYLSFSQWHNGPQVGDFAAAYGPPAIAGRPLSGDVVGKKIQAQQALPTAANLARYAEQGNRELIVLLGDGTQTNLRLGKDLDEKRAADLVAELNRAGAVVLPASGPPETGYWNPAVVTDEQGRAVVTLAVPERTTAWKLFAKGITGETLAGEAEDELVVKSDLFGELKLPLAFTEGDEAEVLASVHNDAVEEGQIEVTLRTAIGGRITEERRSIEAAKGIHELSFKAPLRRPDHAADAEPENLAAKTDSQLAVDFELIVAAGERSDVARRSVPLLPYGMQVFATAGGSAESDTTSWVEPPAGMPLESPSLEVIVGPSVERSLLDIVLAPAPLCQLDSFRIASGLDTATSDLMASLALEKLIGNTREAGGPEAAALDARVRSSLSLIVASQADDGGWSWTGTSGASNRYTSSRVVWALSLARQAGYLIPEEVYEKGINYLNDQVVATPENDYESKAILLQGLAAAGRADFTLANRLYRNRPAMSNAALAHLALALVHMQRQPMAGDILDLLAQRNLDEAASKRQAELGSLPWATSPVEIRTLALLSLEQVAPQADRTRELVDWLLAHRAGHRFNPDKATGPAALALAQWFARTRFAGERYRLTIVVNDYEAAVLDVDPAAGTLTVPIPAKLLKEGKQRINFQIAGRGRFAYQCILAGFVPADKLKSTTADWQVRRHYEPAPRELDGEPIPRGFGILQGSYSAFRNPLTQLPVGQRGHVELEMWRNNLPANTPEEQLEYLVVTEPLPAGATVIEQSVQGGFERFEISPGAITFYVGSRRHVEPIRFDIHGYLPGQYRAAPTVVRNAYRPDQLAVAAPKPLSVLPLGTASADEYRLTPQELYEFGKRHFAAGRLGQAGAYLTELVSQWQLQPDPYKDTTRMLLDVYLDQGAPAEIVRYFEIVKEKWPDVEISFEKIVKVGAAYHEIGEYERSYLVFRATVESSFLRETGVPGFLESQGEFLRSVGVMGRLIAEYPPEPYVAAAQYALAQRVYAYAAQAASDPKLRERKINRVDLVRQAIHMLDGFLTTYPEDPAADQAAFSLANALLELKDFRAAIARSNRFAQRYPDSDYLDSFWYSIGYSHFALGEHEQALEMCRKVAETPRTDRQTGREVESLNKWRAIYIVGQVYHSLGQAAEAIQEYSRVADRFADAQRAIEYFARKEISLPEVTTFKPGEATQAELKFRNVARCDARVYRIDLMKFSLLKRNLGGITAINLAGIRPYFEAVIELGDGRDYRDRVHHVPLPLKEEGAYLVVCRGDDLHASGLVLVTPLAVDVQEQASSGEVRATVKNIVSDDYVADVHVKVIGSRNTDFLSGQTDLRGVFVAEGVAGASTVIAQADGDRYAFFRGQTELGPPPAPEAAPPQSAAAEAGQQGRQGGKGGADLLEGLQEGNRAIQQQQQENLQNLYQKNKQGVAPSEAF